MHSFVSCLMHVVFSTKDRRPILTLELQERLWPYLGGIARENKMRALKVGGVADMSTCWSHCRRRWLWRRQSS
jgi:putative transposase